MTDAEVIDAFTQLGIAKHPIATAMWTHKGVEYHVSHGMLLAYAQPFVGQPRRATWSKLTSEIDGHDLLEMFG